MKKTFSLYSKFKLITGTSETRRLGIVLILFKLDLCFVILGTRESGWKPRKGFGTVTQTSSTQKVNCSINSSQINVCRKQRSEKCMWEIIGGKSAFQRCSIPDFSNCKCKSTAVLEIQFTQAVTVLQLGNGENGVMQHLSSAV